MEKQIQRTEIEKSAKQWKDLYLLGGVTAFIVVFLSLSDIVISMSLGGGAGTIPTSATEWLYLFQNSPLLGLYYLDFLNMITSIVMIPAFFALFATHRYVEKALPILALLIFTIGTAIFITNNAALSMLSLSSQYAEATTDFEEIIIAASAQAVLAKGLHGSPGAFLGFLLPIIASFIMSAIMYRGSRFRKLTAFLGMGGSVLFAVYFTLKTFISSSETLIMIFATVGGVLMSVWVILFALHLFKLWKSENGGLAA